MHCIFKSFPNNKKTHVGGLVVYRSLVRHRNFERGNALQVPVPFDYPPNRQIHRGITPESVDKALDDYFATYPTGDNRSTLSHETLLAIKFEKNLVTFSYSQSQEVEVNVSEIIPNRFYSAVDPATQLFSILGRIFECGVCPPRVNSTMSKKTQLFYI